MNFVNPDDPPEIRLARQTKIIDALVRRAHRQNDVGLTAYSAFQSAIELQGQVAARTRDLERAATELEIVRDDQMRTRKNLDDALATMEGGFALFAEGKLVVSNDLFRALLPDVTEDIIPGLTLERYFERMATSRCLKSTDRRLHTSLADWPHSTGGSVMSVTLELRGDLWYQLSIQRTTSDNVVLLLTEITSVVRRNRSEKESLIDQQAIYLQAVFENMTSGVCTISEDGEVLMFNRRFRELLGLPFTALQKGGSIRRLVNFASIHGLASPEVLDTLETWRKDPPGDGTLHTRLGLGDDRVLDLQATGLPDGGFLLELKDVTLESRTTEMLENRVAERTAELTDANARLRAQYEAQASVEEELRLAKERAEAAVSSKTRFLAAASHDLLQPINAAKLMLATLRETSAETSFAPNVMRLDRAFNSAEQLLHSLLDISRLDGAEPDTVRPSDVSLAGVMQGIYDDQLPLAEQKSVTLDVVPCRLFVRSDPVYLLRSLQNLVVNAIQYNRPGGRVLVGCRRNGNMVQLQVWDTGIGISKKDQKLIFDEFTRAANVPVGSGVGLGLSVVERACRHLRHPLWVRSKPGVGSVFCIEMEVVQGVVDTPDTDHIAPPDGDQPVDLIVMVIENDPDVLFATAQLLDQWGAAVIAVSSTTEALRHVRDMGMPPDVVLADYQLDDGDTGIHAIEQIRAVSGQRVPAILMTANRSDLLISEGREHGFTVMTKPLQISRLRSLIEWKTRWQSMPPTGPEDWGMATDKSLT